MPGTYAHLMITEKALEGFRGNQDIHEKVWGSALTHSHFVHLRHFHRKPQSVPFRGHQL